MNWLVLTVALLGFAGIYTLLPRPRPIPALLGALIGLGALGALGAFLSLGLPPARVPTIEQILFYSFSLTAVLFAGVMITQRNPARAALSFAVVVISVCGLFLLGAAPFLMAATIAVYAGAIVVMFLFVIMLSRQEGPNDANDRSREPFLASAAGAFLLGTLLVVLQRAYTEPSAEPERIDRLRALTVLASDLSRPDGGPSGFDRRDFVERWEAEIDWFADSEARPGLAGSEVVIRARGDAQRALDQIDPDRPAEGDSQRFRTVARSGGVLMASLGANELVVVDQPRSGYGMVATDDGTKPDLPARNVSALGRVLFADHLIAIEMAGTLLLIATVGAIVIAGGRRGRVVR